MPVSEVRVIIYCRVSTDKQSNDRQIRQLRALCQAKQWHVVYVMKQVISGIARNQVGIKQLQNLVLEYNAQKVVVDEISRLGRNTFEVLKIVEFLNSKSISLYIRSLNMETLNDHGLPNPMVQFMLTLLAELARMERQTLSERVKSGLQEAKAKGKQLGRPSGSVMTDSDLIKKHKKVVLLLQKDLCTRDVAALGGVSQNTVLKVKKALSVQHT